MEESRWSKTDQKAKPGYIHLDDFNIIFDASKRELIHARSASAVNYTRTNNSAHKETFNQLDYALNMINVLALEVQGHIEERDELG